MHIVGMLLRESGMDGWILMMWITDAKDMHARTNEREVMQGFNAVINANAPPQESAPWAVAQIQLPHEVRRPRSVAYKY